MDLIFLLSGGIDLVKFAFGGVSILLSGGTFLGFALSAAHIPIYRYRFTRFFSLLVEG